MKERPIIMTAESVRAILAGRKSQTRRVCQQADFTRGMLAGGSWADAVYPARERGWIAWQGLLPPGPVLAEQTKRLYREGFPCPYGAPGDRLWVREGWSAPITVLGAVNRLRMADGEKPVYRADGAALPSGYGRWRSPLHMPRWAARLVLEVTDVRVERLQAISEADAEAEGVMPAGDDEMQDGAPDAGRARSYRAGYRDLWDAINARRGYPWASDPWVFVIEFTRV